MISRRGRHRPLLEPARRLDEWVTNFPIRLRPKLNPRRFQAPDPGWWQRVRLEAGARWGGEVAAARLTDYLKPATYTIYLDPRNAARPLPRSTHATSKSRSGSAENTSTMLSVARERPVSPIALEVLTLVDRIARELALDYQDVE